MTEPGSEPPAAPDQQSADTADGTAPPAAAAPDLPPPAAVPHLDTLETLNRTLAALGNLRDVPVRDAAAAGADRAHLARACGLLSFNTYNLWPDLEALVGDEPSDDWIPHDDPQVAAAVAVNAVLLDDWDRASRIVDRMPDDARAALRATLARLVAALDPPA